MHVALIKLNVIFTHLYTAVLKIVFILIVYNCVHVFCVICMHALYYFVRRHPQNQKYTTYCNVYKGGPSIMR